MDLKKLISLLLAFILIFSFVVSVSADQAQESEEIITLGRIGITMPEITLEIKGDHMAEDVSATLDSKKLEVVDAQKYDPQKNTTCTYILLDLSKSMRNYFGFSVDKIVSYIEDAPENDKIVLITFGTTKVETFLKGDETRDEAIAAVKGLSCDQDGTSFYEALSHAYKLSTASNEKFDREFVLAFSDGIDEQVGSTTFDEVLAQYKSRALPLHAACSYMASKNASDKFSELSRASGGCFNIVNGPQTYGELIDAINDVTIVNLLADTNKADGKEKQLSVKVSDLQVEYNVPVVRSVADHLPPTVTELYYDADKGVFVVTFSEGVSGATKADSYILTDSDGDKIEIAKAYAAKKEDTYEIEADDFISNGKYTFEFKGIKDNSHEGNGVAEKSEVKVSNVSSILGMPVWVAVIVIIVFVLIAAVLVLVLIVAVKRNQENNSFDKDIPVRGGIEQYDYAQNIPNKVKHHIKADNAARIRLFIRTGRTSEQNIEVAVTSSLIIGRSDICDIYIDDTKLSRQHFVLENAGGTFYITDLQSRNGTMLNGIKINSRQRLSSGDKITAGLSDIIVTVLGR